MTVNCRKDENKEKGAGNGPFKNENKRIAKMDFKLFNNKCSSRFNDFVVLDFTLVANNFGFFLLLWYFGIPNDDDDDDDGTGSTILRVK